MSETTDDRPPSKVARLIDEYELDGLGAELETRWTGEGVERMSLRDLADYFNKQLLEQALRNAGMSTLDTDVDSTYVNLTDDEVSTGVRTDTRNRLEQNGVDVDAVETDFVTYQAIRSYLKEWRGAEYDHPSDEEKRANDRESIQRLLTRTLSVTEDRIEKLRDTERIAVEEFEVFVEAQVLCQRCGTQYPVTEFIDNGGCDCLLDDAE
ncbi:rod-determining factor RdfA [Haloarcula amylovorans]|uniref:rod-determining factor RdfA n=1 Tax=Haloarcula amylovorans TaxID=2562280 RepID=UPI0010763BB5|nr:rod-determining factor RdfA [Halomicroarcula amylolytica]